MKYTPGPWEIQEETKPKLFIGSLAGRWSNMIQVFASPSRKKEAEANARLIASAPELLEACKEALISLEIASNRLGMENVTIDHCKQAISKAEGK